MTQKIKVTIYNTANVDNGGVESTDVIEHETLADTEAYLTERTAHFREHGFKTKKTAQGFVVKMPAKYGNIIVAEFERLA